MSTRLRLFICLALYRFVRLIVNIIAVLRFRPIQPPEKPTLTSQDVTVILPSLDGEGEELERTITSILATEPYELLLVTIDANLSKAIRMLAKMPAYQCGRIRCLSVGNPNKRRQMARAVPEVKTAITIFADDDVIWPSTLMPWILAPFEKPSMGGVVTKQRLLRPQIQGFAHWNWVHLNSLYLIRRTFDCSATTYMDGAMPCLSGRTCAYRSSILRDERFLTRFIHESFCFGKYRLNCDDDNFITRWLMTHNWEIYIQCHSECEVQTTLEANSKYLKQCVRWARSNWRSNLTTLFRDSIVYRSHPWSVYAVFATTLNPPAFVMDAALLTLLFFGTVEYGHDLQVAILLSFSFFMFISKFIKNLDHYIYYPIDLLLVPCSILFGWFHGLIKLYSLFTINVTTWGSRAAADVDANYGPMPLAADHDRSDSHRRILEAMNPEKRLHSANLEHSISQYQNDATRL